jgi:hypothetical protein
MGKSTDSRVKPLTISATLISISAIGYAVFQLVREGVYIERLNYLDSTTLILVALLMLRSATKLKAESDLQTVSLGIIACVSFVFGFEAIYKLSFYGLPWRMPPAELREFIIQVGVSLVALAGFAHGEFVFTRGSKIALAIFALSWLFWLAVGFPQLWDAQPQFEALIDLPLTPIMVYSLNRAAKVALFLVYFFLY